MRLKYTDQDGKVNAEGRRAIGSHPEKLGERELLQQWARYANSLRRNKNENTTPLVDQYQNEIKRIQDKQKELSKNDVNMLKLDKNGEMILDEKKFKAVKLSGSKAAKIANQSRDWIGEIAGAMLKDMGYNDTKEAREWLKSIPWMQDLWTPTWVN